MSERIRHTTDRCPVEPSVLVRVWHSDPLLPNIDPNNSYGFGAPDEEAK